MNPYQGYRNPAQNTYEDDNRHYDDNDQYEDQGYEGGHYGQQQGYGHEEEYEYYQPAKNQNVQGKSDRSFQKGTRNEEASFQGGSSNRGFYQPKDQKQMYEEDDVHHDDRNRGRPDEQKESGKIAETIDTNKVKNSKLFQKFLQNENKEVPNKPPKDIKPALKANNYSANKDSKDAPKTKFTSNTPTHQQGFRANEDPYYRRDQDFSNEDSHYRDKSHPTYDTSDAYGPPSKESLSPGRDKGNFFPNREENQYEYGYELRGPDVDLNYHSSSKLVSLQNPEATPQNFQGFPPQNMPYFYPNPYQYMGYGMPPEGQQPQHPQFPMDPNEVFMLRAQVMELNQALAREIDANKALDSKCTEYLTQLEKSAENFEEFKRKIQDQGSGHEEEIFHMENKIKNLSDNLQEKERIEEQQTAEINKLRRKIDAELESRGQLLEEHEELERKKYEELERVKREIEQKEEEIQRLRRETDHSKHDRDNSRVMEERYLKDIKGLKGEIMELNRANEDLKKTCDDKQQQINLGKMEINSLRDQLETMDGQYRDLLAENDRIKRDNFTQKEKLLAAESELKSLRMTLEKLQIDKTQASEALFRAEKALDRERQITADLKLQVSSSNNQWEGPSNYGSRRTGQREYEDDRDQPYRQKESGPRDNYRENAQETNTYEPRRETPKQQYAPQKEEEYQYKPRRPGSGSFTQQQSSQDNFRDTPQQSNPKYGGRSDENTPKIGQRQQVEERSYQQQQQQQQQMPKESKYDERYNRGAALPPKNQQQEQNRRVNEDPYDRNAGKNISGNKSLVQNEPNYGMPVPKLTSQNQVYKPTHNLLAWDEPPAVENKPVNRARDQRQQDPTPPRERPQTAQTRQERDDNQYGGVNKKPQTRGPDAPNQPYAKEEKSYQDFTKEVKTLETDLMNFQMQKDNLTNEMQRLDKVKIKSGANIKRKQEIESDMNQLQTNISNVKNRLRELHALHPY